MDELGDLVDKDQWTDASEFLRQLLGKKSQVLAADGSQLIEESVLVVVVSVLLIVTNELLGALDSACQLVVYKSRELGCDHSSPKQEIQASIYLLDVETLLVHTMFQDKLLKEEERPLMVYLLPHLDLGRPQVRSVGLLAVVALLILHLKLDYQILLEYNFVENFLSNGGLYFEPLGVRLGPDEASIDHLDLLRHLDVFQAVRQHLRRLHLNHLPGRPLPPIALSAVQQRRGADSFSDVDRLLQALDASVGFVWLSHDATETAPHLLGC